MIRNAIAAVIAAGLGATSASANFVVYGGQQSVTAVPTYNTSLTLPQFDPSLGTLTDVELDVFSQNNVVFQVENFAPAAFGNNYFAVTSDIDVTVFGHDFSGFQSAGYETPPLNLAAYDGTFDFGGASGATVSGFGNSDASLDFGASAAFIGTGHFYPIVDIVSETNLGFHLYDNNTLAEQIMSHVTTSATVTYSFTPFAPPPPAPGVPEPATWALLLAGFGGVGLAARRRRMATVAA